MRRAISCAAVGIAVFALWLMVSWRSSLHEWIDPVGYGVSMLRSDSLKDRMRGAVALRCSGRGSERALNALIKATQDDVMPVAICATRALVEVAPESRRAVKAIALAGRRDGRLRAYAAELLSAIASSDAKEDLSQLLGSGDPKVRLDTARELAKLPEWSDVLRTALQRWMAGENERAVADVLMTELKARQR